MRAAEQFPADESAVVGGGTYTGENVAEAIDAETDAVVSVVGQSKEAPKTS